MLTLWLKRSIDWIRGLCFKQWAKLLKGKHTYSPFCLHEENRHKHFCKSILGVRSQTNYNFIYGELVRYPLRIRRNERVIMYWFKVVKCTSTNYIKHIYNVMLQELNMYPNRNSWAK